MHQSFSNGDFLRFQSLPVVNSSRKTRIYDLQRFGNNILFPLDKLTMPEINSAIAVHSQCSSCIWSTTFWIDSILTSTITNLDSLFTPPLFLWCRSDIRTSHTPSLSEEIVNLPRLRWWNCVEVRNLGWWRHPEISIDDKMSEYLIVCPYFPSLGLLGSVFPLNLRQSAFTLCIRKLSTNCQTAQERK